MTPSRRPFLALILAETLSLSGTRLSLIAIPWLVLTTTGDPMMTGIVVFAEMLPYVVAKALGGPLIDRIGARTVAIAGDLGSMVAVVCIPVLHALNALEMYALLPIIFAVGMMRGPADAAKHALVPVVAETGALPLERVTGAVGTIERLASTIGTAGGGALVALIGAAPALTFNAATFGASALVLALGIARRHRAGKSERVRGAGYFHDLAEGWTFLRRDAVLVGIVIMVAATNLLDQAFATVMLPVWAEGSGRGAAVLGLLLAAFSGASAVGAALATGLAERLPRLTVYTVAFLITGFPRFAVFATDLPLSAIFCVIATAGFASGFLNPILSAVIFERIPRPLLGRVSALVSASTWSTMPFGGILAGALIALASLSGAFTIAGSAYFGATMLPLALKSFRAFADRTRPEANKPTA